MSVQLPPDEKQKVDKVENQKSKVNIWLIAFVMGGLFILGRHGFDGFMQSAFSMLAFLLGIGVLVFCHEFGHFQVGRWSGIHAEVFSVGFGTPFFKFKDKYGTQWSIAPIFLGGYVKFRQLNDPTRKEALTIEEQKSAFENASRIKRGLTILAGPMVNLILAFVILTAFNWTDRFVPPALVSQVSDNSWAQQQGFEPYSMIKKINDKAINTEREFIMSLLAAKINNAPLTIELSVLDKSELLSARDKSEFANKSNNFFENVAFKTKVIDVKTDTLSSQPKLDELGFVGFGTLGPAIISELAPGKPAQKAGMQVGDEIIQMNGQPIASYGDFKKMVNIKKSQAVMEYQVVVARKENEKIVQVPLTVGAEYNEKAKGYLMGFKYEDKKTNNYSYFQHGTLLNAVSEANQTIKTIVSLTLNMLGNLFVNENYKQISGPVSMADTAGTSLKLGWEMFVKYCAFVSLSLAIMNLLPIPVLDGGHLMILAFEGLINKDLSEKTKGMLQVIGVVLVGGLMSIAMFNDALTYIFK